MASGADEKETGCTEYVLDQVTVFETLPVPATAEVLVGAPPDAAGTKLKVSVCEFPLPLTQREREYRAQEPVGGVLKTKPTAVPPEVAPEKICGDAALVLLVHVPEPIESTTVVCAAAPPSARSARSAGSAAAPPWRQLRGVMAGRARRGAPRAIAALGRCEQLLAFLFVGSLTRQKNTNKFLGLALSL